MKPFKQPVVISPSGTASSITFRIIFKRHRGKKSTPMVPGPGFYNAKLKILISVLTKNYVFLYRHFTFPRIRDPQLPAGLLDAS